MIRRNTYLYFLTIVLMLLSIGCQSESSFSDPAKNIPIKSVQDNNHEANVQLNDQNDHENSSEQGEELQPNINVFDVLTGEQTTIQAPLANQIYIADDVFNNSIKIFMTDVQGPQLLDLFTGNIQQIQLETSEQYVYHKYYRYNYYFPNTFFENTNYVFESLTTLYRYDNEGSKTAIWESHNQPVYGFAISPDESRIAVLISADNEIAKPHSNLILLDSEGKVLITIEQVAFTSKSDGVIPKIDLKWTDEYTLHIPTEIPGDEGLEYGTSVISFKDKEPNITEIIRTGWSLDSTSYPSPNNEHSVRVIHEDEGIYLVSPDNKAEKLLGRGYFLGWLDTHRIAWYESYKEGYPESTIIF